MTRRSLQLRPRVLGALVVISFVPYATATDRDGVIVDGLLVAEAFDALIPVRLG